MIDTEKSPRAAAGLTTRQAAERLDRDGPNILPVAPPAPVWRQALGQMTHFFAVLLWSASVLALVAGLPELAVAIAVVVVFNGLFAFAQEFRAERAAERLRDLLPRRVIVVRDGSRLEIDATGLVHGDVVVLSAGDHISADLESLETHQLSVDTSALTGESLPVDIGDQEALFAGTFVISGEALAAVTATGSDTRLAGLAVLSQRAPRPHGPLRAELHRLVRTISAIALGVGAAFFVIFLVLGMTAADGLVFAIGVTVALVPEALLPTVTLSLAVGAQRMASRNALVRRLESVQTLGSATFICTDKTGTLTRNQMAVVEVWTPAGSVGISGEGYAPTAQVSSSGPTVDARAREVVWAARQCSSGRARWDGERWRAEGDPMEAAIDAAMRRLGAAATEAEQRSRFAFDAGRRRMSVLEGRRILVKGAPDAVLPLCEPHLDADDAVRKMAARGLRVLAVAFRRWDAPLPPATADEAERDLSMLGLVGLHDPPRAHAPAAIQACRGAGIAVAMVTGDHPETSRAIANQVGLRAPDDPVLIGADLPHDEASLGALIDHDGVVVARVAPEDKLRIAHALQARGHVVAMTGDGVNDGPALHAADIGVAMGRSGTDVAREAADLVLLDDDFATIVAAVEQGRATFANAKHFLTYHLSDNVAELTPFALWALSGGRFPLALGVLQILALDIGTDSFSAVALGSERPAKHVLEQRPAAGRLLNRTVARRAFGLLGPIEAAFGIAAFVVELSSAGWSLGAPAPDAAVLARASGATFTTVVLAQTLNAFLCRSSTRRPGQLGWFSNRMLLWAASVELAIAASFLFMPAVARVLGHAVPTWRGWLVAALSLPALLAADAAGKHVATRDFHRRSAAGTGTFASSPSHPSATRSAGRAHLGPVKEVGQP